LSVLNQKSTIVNLQSLITELEEKRDNRKEIIEKIFLILVNFLQSVEEHFSADFLYLILIGKVLLVFDYLTFKEIENVSN
jgi:hypothetical protein